MIGFWLQEYADLGLLFHFERNLSDLLLFDFSAASLAFGAVDSHGTFFSHFIKEGASGSPSCTFMWLLKSACIFARLTALGTLVIIFSLHHALD